MPKVAAIILSYNHYQVTLKCIESIQKNTYPEIDCFIIDNHSPEKSFQALQQALAGRSQDYLYDTGANLGFAGGLNFGIRKALEKGDIEYLLLLNNDTVLDPDCVAALIQAARDLGPANVYAPAAYDLRSHLVYCGGMNSYIPGLFQFRYMGWPFIPKNHPYPSRYLSGACFLVHRSLFEKVGGLAEELYLYGEDILFGESVCRQGGRIYMVPQARFWHLGSQAIGSLSAAKAYYLSRNVLYLVEGLSKNRLADRVGAFAYLCTSMLLALVTFNPQRLRAIFRGLRDYRRDIKGPMA